MAEYKSRILRRIELNEWWKKVCKEHNICGTQQPCEDAIGRSDMLDAIGHGTTYTSEELQRIIKGLPPVTPQQKIGHWIDDKCSICGKGIEDFIDSREWYRNEEPNFCPFCGVKLVNSQESEG